MANPNITQVAGIYGQTTYLTPTVTTALVLLQNPANSASVLKINNIVAANINGASAVTATVAIYNNGAITQGNAPSNGTEFRIASTISVPSSASLIVVDKTTAIYLQEGSSIIVTSGTASGITFSISYETIS